MFTLTMLFAIYRFFPVSLCFGLSGLKRLKHFGLSTHSIPVLISILLSLWSLSVLFDPLQPYGLYPARLLSPWDSSGQNTGVGSSSLPGHLPNPGIEPRSPTLQADSLPAEPQGKPKNTGVGSLSLFQEIFLTQESNRGLLHCRWILYQLSYEGSPNHPLLVPGSEC